MGVRADLPDLPTKGFGAKQGGWTVTQLQSSVTQVGMYVNLPEGMYDASCKDRPTIKFPKVQPDVYAKCETEKSRDEELLASLQKKKRRVHLLNEIYRRCQIPLSAMT